MADPKPKSKPKKTPAGSGGGIKGALTRKLGPLPFWAWAAIAFAGVYYYRHRNASSSAAAAAAVPTTSADGGTAGLGDSSTGGGSGGGGDSSPSTTGGATPDTTGASLTPLSGIVAAGGNIPAALATGSRPDLAINVPTAASDPNFAADAATRSAESIAAGVAPRFGGVTATSSLPGGATLTTYATGREVEQAPGKNAYVVAAGSTGAKTVAKAAPTPAKVAAPKATVKPAAVASKKPANAAQVKKNNKAG